MVRNVIAWFRVDDFAVFVAMVAIVLVGSLLAALDDWYRRKHERTQAHTRGHTG